MSINNINNQNSITNSKSGDAYIDKLNNINSNVNSLAYRHFIKPSLSNANDNFEDFKPTLNNRSSKISNVADDDDDAAPRPSNCLVPNCAVGNCVLI